jgi:hypothetical protein
MTGATVPCKAIARPAALSAVSLLAVVLSLEAGEVEDRGHQPATVLRWLGTATLLLPRHHFATFPQKPQMCSFHLRQHSSPCTETSPPHLSTQLTRFSPPTQNSTHASSPSSRAREITLTRKPGKRSRQPSENSELVSFVSVFASFPSPHRKKQCAEANKTPVLLCSPLRPRSQVGNYLWLLGKSVESIGSRMK